jgi:hypothetical protein
MDGLTDVIESKAKNLALLVGASAPLLASVLGSPLAGVALSLIASAFGAPSNTVEEITSKIKNDPESAIKLKTIEYQHAETLAQIAAQKYATEVDDRKSARENAPLYRDFLKHLAYLVTIGFFGALILLFSPIPINPNTLDRELLSMLVGVLVSKWQTIIDFFYGSSKHGGSDNGSNFSK